VAARLTERPASRRARTAGSSQDCGGVAAGKQADERHAAWGLDRVKRGLVGPAGAVALLLWLTAAAAWAMSYLRPLDWHLLGIAHSGDLTRVDLDRRAGVAMTPVRGSKVPRHGYWDALWVRSRSGTLSLVAQAADYGGNLRAVHASPPSLIVDLSDPARTRVVAFGRAPTSRPWARGLGFTWDADAQEALDPGDGVVEPVTVRARMITLPYWFIALLGLPLPLRWLRADRRSRR